MEIEVNGVVHALDVEDEMPLLWVLREELGLRGTKFGCGLGQCGACTVHIDGRARRSCITPVSAVSGSSVRTIEDLSQDGDMSPVQLAWLKLAVPQCGYCQPGMQMAATAFLEQRAAAALAADPEAIHTNSAYFIIKMSLSTPS